MPIDLYSTAKKTSQWAFGSPFLNKILGSSLFVAGVVSFIMIILIMIMYPAKPGTPFSIVAKMFVYMFASSLLVIFLHDGVVRYMYEEEKEAHVSEAFMQNITMIGRENDPSYGSMYKTIDPTPVAPAAPVVQAPVVQAQVAPTAVVGSGEHVSIVEGGGAHNAPAKYKAKPYAKNPYE